jgi:superfamily II DNA/RNA helicase
VHGRDDAGGKLVGVNLSESFDSLGVDPQLTAALARDGISAPFPIQALTIRDALAGHDVCGKAKTGSGKTLAFGLPLLMGIPSTPSRHPAGLVLVPTRELAVQVTEVLGPLGKVIDRRVGAVYGGADLEKQVKLLNQGLDIVVATPGRLIDLSDRGAVTLEDVQMLVVDEADRMADMGFMPQVEWLLRKMTNRRQTLLFSATLDSSVDQLVRRYLTDPVSHEVMSETVTVEQMQHYFFKVHEMDKAKVAASIAQGAEKSLIFLRTKRGVDRLTAALKEAGVKAAAIHGDLPQNLRERGLSDFTSGKLQALVATDVAARGLDIEGVDVVVHYDPPEDQKAYLHRSGRTARAGDQGVVVTLLLWDQELAVERLQRRVGLRLPIQEIFSNNPLLKNLVAQDSEPVAASAE